MPTKFGFSTPTFLDLCLSYLRDLVILGANDDVLHIQNTTFSVNAVEGSQGTYFCYVCPAGTPSPADRAAINSNCTTNGSVLLTVLREFF